MPSWTVVFLPFLILTLIATLSFGVMLASFTLFYRDFKHIVPFFVQMYDVRDAGVVFGSPR